MALDLPARAPRLTLLLCALVTLSALGGATLLEPEVDFVDTVPPHEGLDAYRDLLERLDGVRFAAVYQAHDAEGGVPDLRSDAGFDALVEEQRNLTAFLEARFPEGTFSHSLSVYEAMRAGNYMLAKMASAGNAPADAYAVPDDPYTYALVRDQVRDGGSVDDVLAQDGSSALMLLFFSTKDNLEARALAADLAAAVEEWRATPNAHPATTEHATSGLLYASAYTDAINRHETQRVAPLVTGGVLLALLFAVRRMTNALIAVATLVVALAWTFGLMGVLGVRISFLTVFLAPLVIGVGVDYAVHVLHRYEEERDRGEPSDEAVRTALRTTGGAVAVAAATTVAALSMLLFVPAPLFAQIGGVGALGIVLSFLAALTVAPALRAVLPERARRSRHDIIGRRVARIAAAGARRPLVPILLVGLLVGGAAFVAATQTHIESGSAENEFPQDDPVIRLQHRIEDEYGAFQRGYLVVRGDLAQPAALRALHNATLDAADLPLYRESAAVTDLLIADDKTDEGVLDVGRGALLGGARRAPDDRERLPETPEEAEAALDALFADPLWRTLAPFTITDDYSLAIVSVTIDPWEGQDELHSLRDAMRAQAAALGRALGPGYDVAAAGAPVNRAAIVDQTPIDVGIATLGATGAVLLVLGVAWRRRGREGFAFAGLGALIVLLASVVLLAAVPTLDAAYAMATSAFGAPQNNAALNDMFLLAFAVTVAVGVDDLVLLAHRYWEARDANADRTRAMHEAFRHAGRAITGTTLTTFVAFALLADVYFLQSRNLALLTAAGVLTTYALTLALGPLVMRPRRPAPDPKP